MRGEGKLSLSLHSLHAFIPPTSLPLPLPLPLPFPLCALREEEDKRDRERETRLFIVRPRSSALASSLPFSSSRSGSSLDFIHFISFYLACIGVCVLPSSLYLSFLPSKTLFGHTSQKKNKKPCSFLFVGLSPFPRSSNGHQSSVTKRSRTPDQCHMDISRSTMSIQMSLLGHPWAHPPCTIN